MLRGTQVLLGDEASEYYGLIDTFTQVMLSHDYKELVVPTIWEANTFRKKIQGDTLEQMWTFADKKGRDCCLIPEVTAIVQELYNDRWSKEMPKPIRLFYCSRVFRYERPQAGRLREFTQFGCEILGPFVQEIDDECIDLLQECIGRYTADYVMKIGVKRGLGYYIEDGFEVEIPTLGAQKQVAGGGRYAEGIGWAIGIERLLLSGQESSGESGQVEDA